MAELRPLIRACLTGEADSREVTLDATNRRGKRIRCRVGVTQLISPSKRRDGVILMMDEVE